MIQMNYARNAPSIHYLRAISKFSKFEISPRSQHKLKTKNLLNIAKGEKKTVYATFSAIHNVKLFAAKINDRNDSSESVWKLLKSPECRQSIQHRSVEVCVFAKSTSCIDFGLDLLVFSRIHKYNPKCAQNQWNLRFALIIWRLVLKWMRNTRKNDNIHFAWNEHKKMTPYTLLVMICNLAQLEWHLSYTNEMTEGETKIVITTLLLYVLWKIVEILVFQKTFTLFHKTETLTVDWQYFAN